MQCQAIGRGRQLRCWLARSGLASPSAGCLRFLPAVLTPLLLTAEPARSQQVGPGLVTTPITGNQNVTVVGSTQLMPPAGTVAVNPSGSAFVTFNPGLVQPGPISVQTQNASAIVISGGTDIAINPNAAPFLTTITTTGTNAFALNVVSGQHTELLNNVAISTSGTTADAIKIDNPNNIINATGVTVTTTGAGASALALLSGGGSTANFANSSLTSAAGPVIRVEAGSGKIINLTDSTVTAGSGDGRWLYVTTSSINANVIASRSTLIGAAITDPGSTSNLSLINGTVWNMTGSSNVTSLTNNASTINFSPPTGDPTLLASYKTLTVNNYTGAAGGTIGLNTFLGADSSPSDRLVINGGTAAGSSLLRIANTGGPGALTKADGILVVDAINGTTAPGAFALAGEVRGGALDYFLFRGGVNGSNPESWFLRTTFTNGGNGGGSGPNIEELPNGGVEFPTEPPPEVLPPGTYPIIGPELATYGAVQPIARQLGLTSLGTHEDRTGDELPCEPRERVERTIYTKAPPSPQCQPSQRPAIWGRGFGQQIDNRYKAFADPRATGVMAGLQIGVDLLRSDFIPGHMDYAGLYVAHNDGNIDVSGLVTNPAATGYVLQHTGKLTLNAWSGGAYWSHIGPGGWYVDAVLQGTRYTGMATTQFATLNTTGAGFISSLESGVPIALPQLGPGFALEPQAQVLWQRVSFNEANDGLGGVALGTTSGAAGRVGLKGKWMIVTDGGRVWQPYLHANYWVDWGNPATTTFSGVDLVPLKYRNEYMEVGGGVKAKLDHHLSLFANADYQFSVTSLRRDGIKGGAGLRYTW